MMFLKARRTLVGVAVCTWFTLVPLELASGQDVVDPVGFATITIPGGDPISKAAVGFFLVGPVSHDGMVQSVDGATITMQAGAAVSFSDGGSFTIVEGKTLGLTLEIVNVDGTAVTLSRPVGALVDIGDRFYMREHDSLGTKFGPDNQAGFKEGASAAEADTIALWDIESQTSRVFYHHSDDGWVEAGKEGEGDKSSIPVRYPAGLLITRRDPDPISFVFVGHVPVPQREQVFPIKQGANLLTLPYSAETMLESYGLFEAGSEFSVQSATSAPEADVLSFTNIASGRAHPPLYFQAGDGDGDGHWQFVGGGDASDLALEELQALQLFRAGPDGFLRARGVVVAPLQAIPQRGMPIPFTSERRSKDRFSFKWKSESSATYQIQIRGEAGGWEDRGEPIAGDGGTLSSELEINGSGRIQILRLED